MGRFSQPVYCALQLCIIVLRYNLQRMYDYLFMFYITFFLFWRVRAVSVFKLTVLVSIMSAVAVCVR